MTPTKDGGNEQLATGGDMHSGRAAPPFWAQRSAVYFAQAEAQFTLAGISNEVTKSFHVISQLGHRYAKEVGDITPPPQ